MITIKIKLVEVILFFMLKIKNQMLKYLKNIIHLVKNLGEIFDISSPLVKNLGGYIPSIPSGIYALAMESHFFLLKLKALCFSFVIFLIFKFLTTNLSAYVHQFYAKFTRTYLSLVDNLIINKSLSTLHNKELLQTIFCMFIPITAGS